MGSTLRTRLRSTLCFSPPAQRLSSPSRGLAPLTRLWSTLCLSPPGSACLLAESRARTVDQGFGPRFVSLLQAQYFLPRCVLANHGKASVYALPHSTRLSVSPHRVGGSHYTTRLGFTLWLSPPGSACLVAKSRALTAQQGMSPRFGSFLQA